MFLLNLVVIGIYEHLTGIEFMSTLTESKGMATFTLIYFVILIIGDVARAFD